MRFASKVIDMKEGEEWVALGTLFKEMKNQPSILDEYSEEVGGAVGERARRRQADAALRRAGWRRWRTATRTRATTTRWCWRTSPAAGRCAATCWTCTG